MARTLFATMSTLLFSLGLLQAAPINQDGLNAQEKEIAKLHDHVLPGLDEAAYRLVGTHTLYMHYSTLAETDCKFTSVYTIFNHKQ